MEQDVKLSCRIFVKVFLQKLYRKNTNQNRIYSNGEIFGERENKLLGKISSITMVTGLLGALWPWAILLQSPRLL